eukprot:s1818_g6.t1
MEKHKKRDTLRLSKLVGQVQESRDTRAVSWPLGRQEATTASAFSQPNPQYFGKRNIQNKRTAVAVNDSPLRIAIKEENCN